MPSIPNLPFFYLMFRAWSHYKALYGSKMLQHLTSNKLIKSTASAHMDERYAAGLLRKSQDDARALKPSNEEIAFVAKDVEARTEGGKEEIKLLETWNGTLIAEGFEMPELEIEIERAVWQVEQSIAKSKAEADAKKGESTAASKTSQVASAGNAVRDEKR